MNFSISAGFLFLAGGLGALARFGCAKLFHAGLNWPVPWGTAVINVAGCLAFGLLAEWFDRHVHLPPELKTIALTGFFGAFTTFSTYMFEIQALLRDGRWLHAVSGFTIQNGIGFAALIFGIRLARLL